MRRFHAFLACGVAAISCLSPAMAQDNGTTELQEVVVEGEGPGQVSGQASGGADTTGVGEVQGVVVKTTQTGSKVATELKEIPQSVSVIGR
jgi:iron complex outermembrane receptor protein